MSLDSPSTAKAEPPPVPVIENELPSYRAISPLAISSLVCGLISLFSFADLWFTLAGGLAVVLGLWADWKIRRFSDTLTGRGIAQAGIALGLVFSLSAWTVNTVQNLALSRSAQQWAKAYEKLLQTGTMADVAYHRFDPATRKGKAPEELLAEVARNSSDPATMEMYLGTLRNIQTRLTQNKMNVRFVEIERAQYDRLTPWALALYELEGRDADGKEQHEYFLLELKSPENGPLNWYISEVHYPYQRRTHVVKERPVDDGHGHAH